MSQKLILSLAQTGQLLERGLQTHAKIMLLGPPGVGKTTAARKVAERVGSTYVLLDGGNEASWKRLMPYKTPDGSVEPGLAKTAENGMLIVDEASRAQSEAKSLFQTLAGANGHCLITWPDGRCEEILLCIVATANTEGVGVEEMPAAELDRYDFIVWVMPTDEEAAEILASHHGQSAPRARLLWDACKGLATKLDSNKFHKPEGLRFAIALAKGLNMLDDMMSASEVFRSTAERCFPVGKRGAERWRGEFETEVSKQATEFERKLGELPKPTTTAAPAAPAPATVRELSINDLAAGNASVQVAGSLALPWPLTDPRTIVAMRQSFGLGLVKAVLKGIEKGSAKVAHQTTTVEVAGGRVCFNGTARSAVQAFARGLLG